MKKSLKFLVMLMLLMAMLITGCGKGKETKEVNLIVSKNFGEEVIFSSKVEFEEGLSVMDILVDNLDVETAYSGGFVNSIEGIKSTFKEDPKNPKDWFYYIDGEEARIGANSNFPEGGEEIVWDYHSWSMKDMQ